MSINVSVASVDDSSAPAISVGNLDVSALTGTAIGSVRGHGPIVYDGPFRFKFSGADAITTLSLPVDGLLVSVNESISGGTWPYYSFGPGNTIPQAAPNFQGINMMRVFGRNQFPTTVNHQRGPPAQYDDTAWVAVSVDHLERRIAVVYVRGGFNVDRTSKLLYFDFYIFTTALALDYMRKRSRFISAILGTDMERALTDLRSFCSPSQYSSSFVNFYMRFWLLFATVGWANSIGQQADWGAGAPATVTVHDLDSHHTWFDTTVGALRQCQMGGHFALWYEGCLDEVFLQTLLAFGSSGMGCADFAAQDGEAYRPVSGHYDWPAMHFHVFSRETWKVQRIAQGAAAPAVNAPHAPVNVPRAPGAYPQVESVKAGITRVAQMRLETAQCALGFQKACAYTTGQAYNSRIAARQRIIMPACPVFEELRLREPLDESPAFVPFANDHHVSTPEVEDFTSIVSMRPYALLSMMYYLGRCEGYAYAMAMQSFGLTAGLIMDQGEVAAAVDENMGGPDPECDRAALDDHASYLYGLIFRLVPSPEAFNGMSTGYAMLRGAGARTAGAFASNDVYIATVTTTEVLGAAQMLPWAATIPLASDKLNLGEVVTSRGRAESQWWEGKHYGLIASELDPIEAELALRCFIASEVETPATPQLVWTQVPSNDQTTEEWTPAVVPDRLTIVTAPSLFGNGFVVDEQANVFRYTAGLRFVTSRTTVPDGALPATYMQTAISGQRGRFAICWPATTPVHTISNAPVPYRGSGKAGSRKRNRVGASLANVAVIKSRITRAASLAHQANTLKDMLAITNERWQRANVKLTDVIRETGMNPDAFLRRDNDVTAETAPAAVLAAAPPPAGLVTPGGLLSVPEDGRLEDN